MADITDNPTQPKASVPHPDAELAGKGLSTPAPIPEEDLPNREKDLKKARAILDGRDPEVVELVEKVKDDDGLVKVVKDGKHLEVHPATVEAHLAAGWKVSPEVLEEAREEKAKDEAKAEKSTPGKPSPNPTPSRPTPVSPPTPRPTPPVTPAK